MLKKFMQMHLGIIVTMGDHGYAPPAIAAVIARTDCAFNYNDLGMEINTNQEKPIPVLVPILKSLREVVGDYIPRQGKKEDVEDMLVKLNWVGYAYVMKSREIGGSPILLTTSPRRVDLSIWKEISTTHAFELINDGVKRCVAAAFTDELNDNDEVRSDC